MNLINKQNNMENLKIYVQKNRKGYLEIADIGDVVVKNTYDDYLAGDWVELSDEQVAFRDDNPTASVKEIIEMELAPLPPEPTLEELKIRAIEQVKQHAENRLKEAYPPEVLIAKAYSKDADDNAFYFDGFMDFSERIENYEYNAKQHINDSKDGNDINEAVDEFNQLISML